MSSRLRWVGAAALVVAAGVVAPAVVGSEAVAATGCGPLDVSFVVDDTTVMIDTLTRLRAAAPSITNDVVALSGGDYRMGLVTFKDDVVVRSPLVAGNQNAMTAALGGLYQNGGLAEPNASDEALNTVVNTLPVRPGQTDAFTVPWRSHATKLVVLLTGAPPGGFTNVFHDPADVVTAHQRALDANARGVKIASLYVQNPTQYGVQTQQIMSDYATTTGGTYASVRPGDLDLGAYVRSALASCEQSEVYIRDHAADTGVEPHGLDPVWASPDIAVCPTPTPCAGSNPVVGATSYVFVKLNTTGTRIGRGTLELYSTPQGGAALWPSGWTPIGTAVDVVVGTGGAQVMIPWSKVPGPGHFCLLARWVSGTDPMASAEGPDTLANTRDNNNIAWRNVDVLWARTPVERPYRLANPLPGTLATTLRVAGGFDGELVVDLGPAHARWREAGGKAVGFEPVGKTSLRVVNPKDAQIIGIPLRSRETADLTLTFTQTDRTKPGSFVRVRQTDAKGADLGGTEFRFSPE